MLRLLGWRPGQNARDRAHAQLSQCRLYLSIMDRMGIKLDHFGDATTRLERL